MDQHKKLIPRMNASSVASSRTSTPTAICVSNVAAEARAADLEEHFSSFGNLLSVKIMADAEGGRSKGFAFITFADYPQALLDPLYDPDRYENARRFMKSRLSISETSDDLFLDDQNKRDAVEEGLGFEIDSLNVGSLLDETTLYVPLALSRSDTQVKSIRMSVNARAGILQFIVQTEGLVEEEHQPGEMNAQDFMFEVHLHDMAEHFAVSEDQWHITAKLTRPPKLYRGTYDYVEEHGLWEWSREYKQVWYRITALPGRFQDLDFGTHLVYQCRITRDEWMNHGDLRSKLSALHRSTFKMAMRSVHSDTQLTVVDTLPEPFIDLLGDEVGHDELPFELRYSLLCIISQGLLSRFIVRRALIDKLASMDRKFASAALELMMQNEKPIFNPIEVLEGLCARLQSAGWLPQKPKQLPDHCIPMRKVYVTPTRILFMIATVELGNRVVRQFEKHSDRFLRVSFADEHMKKHLSGLKVSNQVLQRIRKFLEKGLGVAGWRYQFLAFSSSQLRDHACWFFAESADCELNCDAVRTWMGNFDHIKVVAKYAARLGQCFSSTTPIYLEQCVVEEVPDVERNGFCFSDGIGRMSVSVAKRVAQVMNLDFVPTAIQVRMGGYKGVLSMDPSLDPHTNIVQFRPSMRKFVTETNNTLGVIRVSSFAPAYLNHQIITLLTSQFIDDDVFLNLQRSMLSKLSTMLREPQNALQMFTQYSAESETFRVLARMVHEGIDPRKEPFLMNCSRLFQCYKMREVKNKARVLLDEGTQLIGVLDETGTLETGQIYVQFTKPDNLEGKKKVTVLGTVLMAKMPAVHPGDIRVLECVDHPNLHHYCDVVVFPQKGDCPHTHEASGSDLDGDIYFVTWNQDLVPVVRNFKPLEYEKPIPMAVQDQVTMSDIKDFFVRYLQNDNLGLIATAHKIHADLSSKGVLSEKCIQLAKLHSLAVDFPKTGVPAEYDSQRFSVQSYPDFLGSFRRNIYYSQKALGKMYREVDQLTFRPSYDNVKADALFLVNGFERFVPEALLIKRNFEFDLLRLMKQYGILSEFEVIMQLMMNFKAMTSSRGEFEVRQRLNEIIKNMAKQYQSLFFVDASGSVVPQDVRHSVTLAEMMKASAWYFVSYGLRAYGFEGLNRFNRPLLSFPWLTVSTALFEIAKRKKSGRLPVYSGDLKKVASDLESSLKQRPRMNRRRPIGSIKALLNDLQAWHSQSENQDLNSESKGSKGDYLPGGRTRSESENSDTTPSMLGYSSSPASVSAQPLNQCSSPSAPANGSPVGDLLKNMVTIELTEDLDEF